MLYLVVADGPRALRVGVGGSKMSGDYLRASFIISQRLWC